MKLIRISVAFSLWVAAMAGQDFATLAQHAVQLQQAGDDAGAAAAYRQLLAMDPSQVATHVNLAIVLVHLGQFDEAIQQYEAADELLPGDPRIALNLALAYEKSGRMEEACQRLDKLHTVYPSEQQPTLLLADCSLQLGQDARVVELLRPLAANGDEEQGVDYMLGMALLHEHDVAGGQQYLDRILRHGDTAQARFLLGTRMFESHDYPAAVQQLAGAIALDPTLPKLQSLYGRALLNTGDPDAAIEAFRAELAHDPSDFESQLGLAQILSARHQYDEALPLAESAHALKPENMAACLADAEVHAGLHRWMAARPLAEEAAAALPQSIEAQRTLLAVYSGLHESARATAVSQKVRALQAAEQAAMPGPKVNDIAPDFVLPRSGGAGTVSLSKFRGKQPVVLIFGSYTCPNFRDSAAALKGMEQRYGSAVPFLLVYIREAHAAGDWQSGRNTRENVDLAAASTMTEKEDHAIACSRKLHLPFPAVVDGLDNAVESAYAAWPARAFVVGIDGRILYSSRLTELDFEPSEMESVLRELARPRT